MFEIYGKTNCASCQNAAELLEEKGFDYDYFNVEEERVHLEHFKKEWPGRKAVPAITTYDYDGTPVRIGGYEDLVRYLNG